MTISRPRFPSAVFSMHCFPCCQELVGWQTLFRTEVSRSEVAVFLEKALAELEEHGVEAQGIGVGGGAEAGDSEYSDDDGFLVDDDVVEVRPVGEA